MWTTKSLRSIYGHPHCPLNYGHMRVVRERSLWLSNRFHNERPNDQTTKRPNNNKHRNRLGGCFLTYSELSVDPLFFSHRLMCRGYCELLNHYNQNYSHIFSHILTVLTVSYTNPRDPPIENTTIHSTTSFIIFVISIILYGDTIRCQFGSIDSHDFSFIANRRSTVIQSQRLICFGTHFSWSEANQTTTSKKQQISERQ